MFCSFLGGMRLSKGWAEVVPPPLLLFPRIHGRSSLLSSSARTSLYCTPFALYRNNPSALRLKSDRKSHQPFSSVILPVTMDSQAEIPKQYKACVYDDPGRISTKIETLDMPEPGPGEVLINLYALYSCIQLINKQKLLAKPAPLQHRTHSGVCHSDIGVMENSASLDYFECRTQRSQQN